LYRIPQVCIVFKANWIVGTNRLSELSIFKPKMAFSNFQIIFLGFGTGNALNTFITRKEVNHENDTNYHRCSV
jgi:hypothetical protein